MSILLSLVKTLSFPKIIADINFAFCKVVPLKSYALKQEKDK